MKKWSIPVLIAIIALLMPMSSAMVAAQDEAGLSLSKSADLTSAAAGETITYTYTVSNTDNFTIENISLVDDKIGAISLTDTTLAPGESTNATATYAVTISDLPGPIINTATVTGTDPDGTLISATTANVSISLYINKWLLLKSEILKLSGVPGKGIEKAPGLQKLFNPNSKAIERAGKKDKDEKKEQLRIRQMTENHGAVKGQIRTEQKVRNQR
jgi:hypothetical protein